MIFFNSTVVSVSPPTSWVAWDATQVSQRETKLHGEMHAKMLQIAANAQAPSQHYIGRGQGWQ